MMLLVNVGASAGLDPEELREAPEQGRYTDTVLRDERLAQEIGVSGVPAMLMGPAEVLLRRSSLWPQEGVRETVERALRSESRAGHTGPIFRRDLPTLGD